MLANIPAPVPLLVLLPVISGLTDVPKQTPLAVTVAPPSEVILPPVVADIEVTDVIVDVLTVGKLARVVNEESAP